MNGTKLCEESVRGFRFVGSDPDGTIQDERKIQDDRRHWRREGIYLSAVCLAVHLTPKVGCWESDDEAKDAKEALYRYLRQVHQTALEHGLVCPLACVVSVDDPSTHFAKTMVPWGSDQDWHRGSFTLYVEGTNGEYNGWWRLSDLLQPKNEVLVPTESEERDGRWYAKALNDALDARPPEDPAAAALAWELVNVCSELFASQPTDEEALKRFKERRLPDELNRGAVADWAQKVVVAAQEQAAREVPA